MKRIFYLLLAAVILLSALSACTPGQPETDALQLWFVTETDSGSSALGTQSYLGESGVPAVMDALLAGPAPGSGMTSPIPSGTELQTWSQSGSIVQVDLSREYASLTGIALTLADYCIALTLTGLGGVEGVRITVNGASLSQGNRKILRREDVLFSGAEEEPVDVSAALCFRRSGSSELGVELRIFRLTENESATLAVLQALAAGPQEAGLETLLPGDVEVYSARVDEGVCYADFSSVLLTQMPAAEEDQYLVVRSIVESLCSLSYVQGVQILVEGEPLDWYGMQDVSQPLH